MRRFGVICAASLGLASLSSTFAVGRADELLAQKDPAEGEKPQDTAKEEAPQADDAAKKKQAAAQEEYKKFAEPFFKDFQEKMAQAGEGKDVDFGPLVKQYCERLATKSSPGEVRDALQVAQILQMYAPPAEAKSVYGALNKLADRVQGENPKLTEQLKEHLKGPLAVLDMIGTTPVIEGALANGDKFDWSKYKGKVVLLDFWATWCGPCIGEIPNVKKAYEKYHDKGFEVVGVSLDEDIKALNDFQEKEKLPWPSIFPTGNEKGFEAPLAKKFMIEGIPATFLIGRDGKLVSVSARGPRLEAQLEKLLEQK